MPLAISSYNRTYCMKDSPRLGIKNSKERERRWPGVLVGSQLQVGCPSQPANRYRRASLARGGTTQK